MAVTGNWKVVTFNEGAPFDPNDLNQLQDNLTDVFTKSTNLLNATKDNSGQNRIAIIDQGTVSISLNGTTPQKSSPVTFSPSFIAGTDTGFVASMGQALTSTTGNVSVSAVLNTDKTGGTIYAVSNKATTATITVNWIATQLKTI